MIVCTLPGCQTSAGCKCRTFNMTGAAPLGNPNVISMVTGNALPEIAQLRLDNKRMQEALTKIRYLEASDADTWIWQAQEAAREALEPTHT